MLAAGKKELGIRGGVKWFFGESVEFCVHLLPPNFLVERPKTKD
jgi:hypothetical protein